MNAKRLLAHYERIADAPDAIAHLRRFILDLAVRGKIVPQSPLDEPASELLKRITKEKMLLDGKVSRGRRLEGRGRAEEFVFELPLGWVVSTLGDATQKITDGAHQTPTYVTSGIPFVSVKDFSGGRLNLSNTRYITEDEHRGLYQRCDPKRGDILIGRIGTLGRAVLVDTDVEFSLFVSVGMIRFSHANLSPDFFRLLLNSPLVESEFDRIKIGGGTHTNKLNLGDLKTVALPIPPLAEQHRIVAKVDELMALCDRLEAARTAREATRNRLAAASLARLNAPDPEAFNADTRFALDALPALTTRPDQIKQLRQTILNLAVVGRLTTTSPNAESAEADLNLIHRKKLENSLRKPKTVEPISVDEHWCKLPNRWAWARWDHISDWITYGFTRPMPHEDVGIPIITGKNVNNGRIIFETAHRTPVAAYNELNEKDRPKRGDVLITKDGSIGRTAIVDSDEPFCINQSVAVLWLRSCHLNRRFLQLALDCPQMQGALLAKTEGVAIKHISVVDLGNMVFPVPPINEQDRIVAKVDDLMELCDRLEASLTTTAATRRRLLDALLAEALGPVAERELEAVA